MHAISGEWKQGSASYEPNILWLRARLESFWSQTSLVPMVSSQLALSTPWHHCGIVMAEEAKLLEQVTRLEASWFLLTWIELLEASSEKPVLLSGPSVSEHCWTMSFSVNYILEMLGKTFASANLFKLCSHCWIVEPCSNVIAIWNYAITFYFIFLISSIIHNFRSAFILSWPDFHNSL